MSKGLVAKLVYNGVIIGYRYLIEGRYVDVSEDKYFKYASKMPDTDTLWTTNITNQKYMPLTKDAIVLPSQVYTDDEVRRHYRAEDISSDHHQLVHLFATQGVLRPEFVNVGLPYKTYWFDFMRSKLVKVTPINESVSVVSTVLGGSEVVDKALVGEDTLTDEVKLQQHASILLSGFKRGFLLSTNVLDDFPILHYANKSLTALTKYLRVSLNGIIEYKGAEGFKPSGISVYELSSLTDVEKINFVKAIGLADFYETYAIMMDFYRKVRAFEGVETSKFAIGNADMSLALVNRVLHLASYDELERELIQSQQL